MNPLRPIENQVSLIPPPAQEDEESRLCDERGPAQENERADLTEPPAIGGFNIEAVLGALKTPNSSSREYLVESFVGFAKRGELSSLKRCVQEMQQEELHYEVLTLSMLQMPTHYWWIVAENAPRNLKSRLEVFIKEKRTEDKLWMPPPEKKEDPLQIAIVAFYRAHISIPFEFLEACISSQEELDKLKRLLKEHTGNFPYPFYQLLQNTKRSIEERKKLFIFLATHYLNENREEILFYLEWVIFLFRDASETKYLLKKEFVDSLREINDLLIVIRRVSLSIDFFISEAENFLTLWSKLPKESEARPWLKARAVYGNFSYSQASALMSLEFPPDASRTYFQFVRHKAELVKEVFSHPLNRSNIHPAATYIDLADPTPREFKETLDKMSALPPLHATMLGATKEMGISTLMPLFWRRLEEYKVEDQTLLEIVWIATINKSNVIATYVSAYQSKIIIPLYPNEIPVYLMSVIEREDAPLLFTLFMRASTDSRKAMADWARGSPYSSRVVKEVITAFDEKPLDHRPTIGRRYFTETLLALDIDDAQKLTLFKTWVVDLEASTDLLHCSSDALKAFVSHGDRWLPVVEHKKDVIPFIVNLYSVEGCSHEEIFPFATKVIANLNRLTSDMLFSLGHIAHFYFAWHKSNAQETILDEVIDRVVEIPYERTFLENILAFSLHLEKPKVETLILIRKLHDAKRRAELLIALNDSIKAYGKDTTYTYIDTLIDGVKSLEQPYLFSNVLCADIPLSSIANILEVLKGRFEKIPPWAILLAKNLLQVVGEKRAKELIRSISEEEVNLYLFAYSLANSEADAQVIIESTKGSPSRWFVQKAHELQTLPWTWKERCEVIAKLEEEKSLEETIEPLLTGEFSASEVLYYADKMPPKDQANDFFAELSRWPEDHRKALFDTIQAQGIDITDNKVYSYIHDLRSREMPFEKTLLCLHETIFILVFNESYYRCPTQVLCAVDTLFETKTPIYQHKLLTLLEQKSTISSLEWSIKRYVKFCVDEADLEEVIALDQDTPNLLMLYQEGGLALVRSVQNELEKEDHYLHQNFITILPFIVSLVSLEGWHAEFKKYKALNQREKEYYCFVCETLSFFAPVVDVKSWATYLLGEEKRSYLETIRMLCFERFKDESFKPLRDQLFSWKEGLNKKGRAKAINGMRLASDLLLTAEFVETEIFCSLIEELTAHLKAGLTENVQKAFQSKLILLGIEKVIGLSQEELEELSPLLADDALRTSLEVCMQRVAIIKNNSFDGNDQKTYLTEVKRALVMLGCLKLERLDEKKRVVNEAILALAENQQELSRLKTHGYGDIWREPMTLTFYSKSRKNLEMEEITRTLRQIFDEYKDMCQTYGFADQLDLDKLFHASLPLEELQKNGELVHASISANLGNEDLHDRLDEIKRKAKEALARVPQNKPKEEKHAQYERFTIKFHQGFFETLATCNDNIPGCYAPKGMHAEKPLQDALRVDATFISIYNDGREIENAEVKLLDQGIFVQPHHASVHNFDTSEMWLAMYKTLLDQNRVPRIILSPTSPAAGHTSLLPQCETEKKLEYRDVLFSNGYYDEMPKELSKEHVVFDRKATIKITTPSLVSETEYEALQKGKTKKKEQKKAFITALKKEIDTIDYHGIQLSKYFMSIINVVITNYIENGSINTAQLQKSFNYALVVKSNKEALGNLNPEKEKEALIAKVEEVTKTYLLLQK